MQNTEQIMFLKNLPMYFYKNDQLETNSQKTHLNNIFLGSKYMRVILYPAFTDKKALSKYKTKGNIESVN